MVKRLYNYYKKLLLSNYFYIVFTMQIIRVNNLLSLPVYCYSLDSICFCNSHQSFAAIIQITSFSQVHFWEHMSCSLYSSVRSFTHGLSSYMIYLYFMLLKVEDQLSSSFCFSSLNISTETFSPFLHGGRVRSKTFGIDHHLALRGISWFDSTVVY